MQTKYRHTQHESTRLPWLLTSCSYVMLVSPEDNFNTAFASNKGTKFLVRWADTFPTTTTDCATTVGCQVVLSYGGSCLCDATVTNEAVYTDPAKIPDAATVRSTLFIGSYAPEVLGGYKVCDSCSGTGVAVYVKDGTDSILDEKSIFAVKGARGEIQYFRNHKSSVSLGSDSMSSTSSRYQFRNPPSFMPTAGDQLRSSTHGFTDEIYRPWAEAEEDALVDHLFEHENTPPFIAHALLQRFTTSNPSPSYIKTVADAFRWVGALAAMFGR